MSKISLKHSGGNVVSLNSPTSAPTSADVAFKLPNADGSAGQFMKTDGSGNLSFGAVTDANDFVKLSNVADTTSVDSIVFQSLDTATYKAFRFVFAGLPVSDNTELNFRFMSGSSIASSSNYSWAITGVSGSSSHYEDHSTGNSIARIHNNGGNADTEGWRTIIDIVFQTTNDWTSANNYATWIGNRNDGSNNYRFESGSLYYENDADTDGFNLAPASGQFNKYSYTLYGVKR